MQSRINTIYSLLLKEYGPQGWWPLLSCNGVNPTKTGSMEGYHPAVYSYPRTESERFEICVGAILTQNTAWPNVEKALSNLKKARVLSSKKIQSISTDDLSDLIRPAGYFNQKSRYLKNTAEFFEETKGSTPSRNDLLSVKGIGEETADSILLYAFSVPSFVIDAYTRRIFGHLGLIDPKSSYRHIQKQFEEALPRDVVIYQEYHALIVEHAKRHYAKKPWGTTDPLCA